ncbi:exodeoxyribonuclease VII small subunit [Orbus wheelerorum]|uniref:exodeoxyribonuclease VII small subunit n=1 Tax=Orbus wheelerorum TaxID=3074111 RepID=UPI00370D6474
MAKAREKVPSFEEILKELENVVSKLELGNLPLDEALNEFEKGVKLSKQGQVQLQNAEQRIQILLTESSDAQLTDFVDSAN